VPGAGFGWEVKYLFEAGFKNVFLLDFSAVAIEKFKGFCPYFPNDQIIVNDFFEHSETYDLIVEQTFFSGIPRSRRQEYFRKCSSLLSTRGKLVGLFFNHEFPFEGPPFGGTSEEYTQLLKKFFEIITFDLAYNSIKPRAQREIFFILQKK
ncbi:MAG: SAM-dependent methyltransferase, partial [Ignavibacteria bacterium]|nr:SAM-dependent methyltransferase [Ignavibacteria bacterium]